eukprot:TRINITY_DN6527_c0_g1_i2.p1 TRINITY_DN6527_c0_g1~~TRINITY_DN6527_c0_g1_i2.p1  ORF type:complete len:290 (+),score=71.78 TRINITY_DN6527_c0_g1_i2:306-1175(+)
MLSIESSGKLKKLDSKESAGRGACSLRVDRTGKFVIVSNYHEGTIGVLPIQGDKLGEASTVIKHEGSSINKARQNSPHCHDITIDDTNQFVFVCDLGIDKIGQYLFDAETGKLKANQIPFVEAAPGSGPRHLVFHPSGKYAYAGNELDNTVDVFSFDVSTGRLTRQQTISSLPVDMALSKAVSHIAELCVEPKGEYLYVSNRFTDTIAIFHINPLNGLLEVQGHQPTLGQTVRSFVIEPSGRFLLAGNQDTHSIVVFALNPDNGLLKPVGDVYSVFSPAVLCFVNLQKQ